AAPPGVHSEHGIDDWRTLLSRRSGGGLRARRRVRVLLRRSAAADHRSGGIADQSARNQMKSPGAVILAARETRNTRPRNSLRCPARERTLYVRGLRELLSCR